MKYEINDGRQDVDNFPGIMRPVGNESMAVISRLAPAGESQEYVGNVLRRTCIKIGEAACKDGCALRAQGLPVEDTEKRCADANLGEAIERLGMNSTDVLMVGVTANDVGFGDQLTEYAEKGKLVQNPGGWRELPGFNAFFARASEVPAIGSRLADCGHLAFEFKDRSGETIIGFEHATRPNMSGRNRYAFEIDGMPMSYTEFALTKAVSHYDADPGTIQIRLSSSIRPQNFVKSFPDVTAMEQHLPGWEADGFAVNTTNRAWRPGMPVTDVHGRPDVWYADARGLILHDTYEAMNTLGIPAGNFACDDMLDPADSAGQYSSHENRAIHGDSRDLYMVAHRTAHIKS